MYFQYNAYYFLTEFFIVSGGHNINNVFSTENIKLLLSNYILLKRSAFFLLLVNEIYILLFHSNVYNKHTSGGFSRFLCSFSYISPFLFCQFWINTGKNCRRFFKQKLIYNTIKLNVSISKVLKRSFFAQLIMKDWRRDIST